VSVHFDLVNRLAVTMGGLRPERRCLGAPLGGAASRDGSSGDSGGASGGHCGDAAAALLDALRRFEGWPAPGAQRKGVASQHYMTLKRRDIDAMAAGASTRPLISTT